MAEDLTARLTRELDVAEGRLGGLVPDPATRAAVVRRVRRGRAARTFAAATGVAAVGAVVAAATWIGVRAAPPLPATTPTPAPSVTPSSTPAHTPTPTAARVAVERPGMPPMVAVDDAVLESVGSGWALTLYVATGGDASALGPGAVGNVLVLASPDGQLYWVGDDVDAVIGPWDGSPQVPVVTGGGTARGRLDLRTGDVTELPRPAGLPADARPLRSSATLWTADHDNGKGSIWTSDGGGPARLVADDLPPYTASTAVVNPGETAALVTTWSVDGAPSRVVDLVAGGSRDLALGLAGTMCELVAWESATTVLSVCGDSSFEARPFSDTTGRPRLVRGDVTGSSAPVVLRDFAVGDLVPVQGVTLPGGRVAATAYAIGPDVLPESCMDRVGVWRDGAMAALDADLPEGYVSLGVSGGRLVITGRDQCLGDETRSTSVVLDLMSGRTTTLPPGPGDGAVMSASAPVVAP